MPKTPRNSPCPCGSGKKYKKCCGTFAVTDVNEFFDTPAGRHIAEEAAQMLNPPPPPPRMVSRPQVQTLAFGQKIRAVRNALYFRPPGETFHDFQLNLLLWTLGKNWFDEQMRKPPGERHIILRWRDERNDLLEKYRDPAAPLNKPVKAPLTGKIKALQVLADDIYQLQHALKTPRKIVERLRNMREFQSARYEILVASLFARCGFDIQFIDDRAKKNPEFFATKSGERIAVEAKSRHRPGVLHERGEYVAEEPRQARIRHLFQEALEQNPGGAAFVVFIDVNLPLNPQTPPPDRIWVKEAMKCFEERKREGLPEQDSGLILSNVGWHYHRDIGAPPPEFVTVKPEQPVFPLRSETWALLERALNEYGLIVDEENPPKPKRRTTSGWFHYGYFVKGPGNSLRAAGESFARTAHSYKKGDSLGVKGGVEGVVVSVIHAENADSHDFDVLVVVEERVRRT